MRQEFIEKLQVCGSSRDKLVKLMVDIDTEKRSIKSRLSRMSSEPDGEFGKGRERQVQIRKMKDKERFLIEEREVVRSKLGSIKMDSKALNRASNSRSIEFSYAFIAAAEILLTEDQYLEVEMKASEILSSN